MYEDNTPKIMRGEEGSEVERAEIPALIDALERETVITWERVTDLVQRLNPVMTHPVPDDLQEKVKKEACMKTDLGEMLFRELSSISRINDTLLDCLIRIEL